MFNKHDKTRIFCRGYWTILIHRIDQIHPGIQFKSVGVNVLHEVISEAGLASALFKF